VKLELLSRTFCVLNCCAVRVYLFACAHHVSFSVFLKSERWVVLFDFCEINLTGHNEEQSIQLARVKAMERLKLLCI
jgi:hypothetical protein